VLWVREKEQDRSHILKPSLPEAALEALDQYDVGLLKQNKLYAMLREIVGKKLFDRTRSNHENMKSRCAEG